MGAKPCFNIKTHTHINSECCICMVANVDIGGKRIPFRSSVRNLGVHLDQTLSMQQHISSVCRAAYLELRRIASIRPHLTQSATAQLVSSAITSRLDYCNSILPGLPLKQISRLQRVQNNAAKLVLRKSKYDHVTPLLQELTGFR